MRRWGSTRRPNPHGAHMPSAPAKSLWWPPFSPPQADDAVEEGEEGWVAEPIRLYADALARQVRPGSTKPRRSPRPSGRCARATS